MGASGPVVTADVWRIPARAVPGALLAAARDRRRLRALRGASFVKLLGTGRTFDVRQADPTRWMMLACWSDPDAAGAARQSPALRSWAVRSTESWHATLRPLTARGRWSRRSPFLPQPGPWRGPVAAVTRARLAPRRAVTFWRAAGAPAADLAGRPGLCLALAIGEAPLGVQGTFSLWRDAAALREYAYAGAVHRAVIARTREVGWYAESLFARFAVLDTCGSVDGRDPLEAAR